MGVIWHAWIWHKSYGKVPLGCPMVTWVHRKAVLGGHLDNRCSNAHVLLVLGEGVTYGIQGGLTGPFQELLGRAPDGPGWVQRPPEHGSQWLLCY